MPPLTIFKKGAGVNTSVDPSEIEYNAESGVSELAVGVNVDITNSGRVEMTQTGYLQFAAGSYHSSWRDTGDAFCGKGTELHLINRDRSRTLLRSGLSGGRIDYCQIGPETYYGNGREHGVVLSGLALPWPTTTNPLEKNRVLEAVPPPEHLEAADGRIYFSVGNMFAWTELLVYGVYAPAANFIMFGSKIRMIKPVESGIFLSTGNNTWFLSGHDPHKFSQSSRPVGPPAHEWSVETQYRDGLEIGLQAPGQCAFWTCDQGSCVGTPGGQVIVMNKDKIVLPRGTRGATLLYGDQLLSIIAEI